MDANTLSFIKSSFTFNFEKIISAIYFLFIKSIIYILIELIHHFPVEPNPPLPRVDSDNSAINSYSIGDESVATNWNNR